MWEKLPLSRKMISVHSAPALSKSLIEQLQGMEDGNPVPLAQIPRDGQTASRATASGRDKFERIKRTGLPPGQNRQE
jgi:hypothetical protein